MAWVECMKVLLLNVCYCTAKAAEIVSREMWVSTGQLVDCAGEGGGGIPLYSMVWICGRSFCCNGLFLTQPSHQ